MITIASTINDIAEKANFNDKGVRQFIILLIN